MDASDAAAVIVAAASVAALAVLVVAAVALIRSAQALRAAAEQFRHQSVPMLDHMRSTVEAANEQLERVDGVLSTAESVSATVDSASRLAYLALSNPVIKTVAFVSGTGRAARRFRRRRNGAR